jgi:hypothetical protein
VSAEITAEALVYWYLRLNGFLTITNFIVHPDEGRNQETDADILGVRFPYRAENLNRPMKDHEVILGPPGKIHMVIGEVKTGLCNLNGPWTKPERRNMHRVLKAIGILQSREAETAAAKLYDSGRYENQRCRISLLCFGKNHNPQIAEKYSMVPQILWSDLIPFIYERFKSYRNQKVSHLQWDEDGHKLWDAFEQSRDASIFASQFNFGNSGLI